MPAKKRDAEVAELDGADGSSGPSSRRRSGRDRKEIDRLGTKQNGSGTATEVQTNGHVTDNDLDLSDLSDLTEVEDDAATPEGQPKQSKSREGVQEDAGEEEEEDMVIVKPNRKSQKAKKGKVHEEQDHRDEEQEQDDVEEEDEDEEEEEEHLLSPEDDSEDEFQAPKSLRKKPAASLGRGRGRGRGTPRGGGVGRKLSGRPSKSAASRKSTKGKQKITDDAGGEAEDEGAEGGADKGLALKGEYVIKEDNNLFNAVKNPNTALETTVEEWIDAYQSQQEEESSAGHEGEALAEFINFVFRASGCNSSVDRHEVQDLDGVVETLEGIQADFIQTAQRAWPLIAKSKALKKFRKSLSSFLTQLMWSAHESEILYDDVFCETLQTWLVALSSSHVRAFRHTATVVALFVSSAICDIRATLGEEFGKASRQRDAEKKKGRADKARLKDMEQKVTELHKKQERLNEYLEEIFSAVFVHRYRDAEPTIRGECIRELGTWMRKYPDRFLDGDYFRYLGWVLTDLTKDVRLEAVKALAALYSKEENIGAMQHFTERFKSRLVEMATSEVDLQIRIVTIRLLQDINTHGLLEEDQQDDLACLIYHVEPKVRKAVAGFVAGLVNDLVEERTAELEAHSTPRKKGSRKENSEEEENQIRRLRLKCFSSLMVKYAAKLDEKGENQTEDGDGNEGNDVDYVEASQQSKKGRVALAVEAVWDDIDSVQDWETLVEFLLLDHSSTEETGSAPVSTTNTPRKGKKQSRGGMAGDEGIAIGEVDEAYRLTDDEESFLLEALVASLRNIQEENANNQKKNKDTEDDGETDVTRGMIRALPRLFAKHQTDSARISEILLITPLFNLDMYLEMRVITAYEALWDDVIKQFLLHVSPVTIQHGVQAIDSMMAAGSLSNTNKAKFSELEEKLLHSIRSDLVDKDVESAAFEDEELATLSASLVRLEVLLGHQDLSSSLSETDDGTKESLVDMLLAVAERGKFGFQPENKMVESAIKILSTQVFWQAKHVMQEAPFSAAVDKYVEMRENLVQVLAELAIGQTSNTSEPVKRTAFIKLMDLYGLFGGSGFPIDEGDSTTLGRLRMIIEEERQYRCAGFVQAEIDRYADEMKDGDEESGEAEEGVISDEDDDGSDASEDDEAPTRKRQKTGVKKRKQQKARARKEQAPKEPRISQLRAAYSFSNMIAAFVRAIRAGAIDIQQSTVVLAHYGRFGPFFDQCARFLGDTLKNEGVYGDRADTVASVSFQSLRDSIELLIDGQVKSEEQAVSLSRLLSSSVVVRGAQLSITKTLPSKFFVQIHKSVVDWAAKKVAAFEASDKKTLRRDKALLIFKALVNMLIGISGRDCLKIKTHMEQANANAKIKPAKSRGWDPYHSYEKRLLNIMAKDTSIKNAAETVNRSSPVASNPDDQRVDDEDEGFNERSDQEQRAPLPRRRGRPVTKSKPKSTEMVEDEGEEDGPAELAREDSAPIDEASPPRKRPKPRRVLQKSAATNGATDDFDNLFGREKKTRAASSQNDAVPAKAGSKRRAREDDVEEAENLDDDDEQLSDEDDDAGMRSGEDEEVEAESLLLGKGEKAESHKPLSQASTLSLSDVRAKKRSRR